MVDKKAVVVVIDGVVRKYEAKRIERVGTPLSSSGLMVVEATIWDYQGGLKLRQTNNINHMKIV